MPGLGDLIRKYRQSPDTFALKKIGFLTEVADGKLLVNKLIDQDRRKLSEKYRYPATIKMAKQHTRAIKFGRYPGATSKRHLCPCCELNIRTIPLSVRKQHTTVLFGVQGFQLNSCVAFFFTFIKYIIVMLILRFLILDGYNMITNLINGDYCYEKCSKQFWSLASIFHKYNREDLVQVTDILVMAVSIVFIFYFLAYRRLQYSMYDKIDKQKQSQDDFTVFVENIPVLNFPEQADSLGRYRFDYDGDLDRLMSQKIAEWIGNLNPQTAKNGSLEADYIAFKDSKGQPYNEVPKDLVKSISLCYDLTRMERISLLRKQLIARHEKNIKNEQQSVISGVNEAFDTIPEQIEFLNEAEVTLSKSYSLDEDLVFRTTHFVGSAFISFKYQHYRDLVVFLYQQNKQSFLMKGKNLKISKANSPSDIMWKNIKVTSAKRKYRVALSYFILFVFLLLAFGLLLGSDRVRSYLLWQLKQAQNYKQQEKGGINWASMAVTLITTLVTMGINSVLQIFAYKLTDWEKHQSKGNAKSSLVGKLLISQFFNSALIYLVLSNIRQEDKDSILSQQGLIYQITNLLILSGPISIITNFINLGELFRTVKVWYFYGHKSDDQQIKEYQVHLNRQCEHIQFDLAQKYAYYLLQLYIVSFYSYIVPVCVPAVAIIMAIQYWVDKFTLFHRASLFYELDYNLSRYILKMAEGSVLVMAAGSLYFSFKVYDKSNTFLVVTLCISLAFVLLSVLLPESIQRKIFQPYEFCEVYDYDQCIMAGKFYQTYWLKNPATMLVEQNLVSRREVVKNQAAAAFTLLGSTTALNITDEMNNSNQNQYDKAFI